MSVPPGWYRDPAEPTVQRWWDGEGWVGEPLPADATPPPGPPPATGAGQRGLPLPAGSGRPAATEPARAGHHPPPSAASGRSGAEPAVKRAANGTAEGVPPPDAHPPPAPDQVPPTGQPGSDRKPWPAGGTEAPGAGVPPGWPYQRPEATPAPPPQPHGYPLATLGSRLIARLIDIGLVLGLNVLVNGWFVYQFWNEISPVVREAWQRSLAGESLSGLPDAGDAGNLQLVILVLAAALWFAYEVPAIANTGQTPGKRLLRIQVVRLEEPPVRLASGAERAGPVGFGRSFRRWNTMGLPTLLWWCFGIGFLLQLIDALFVLFDRPLQQALHDKSAFTAVISVAGDAPKETPDEPADPS